MHVYSFGNSKMLCTLSVVISCECYASLQTQQSIADFHIQFKDLFCKINDDLSKFCQVFKREQKNRKMLKRQKSLMRKKLLKKCLIHNNLYQIINNVFSFYDIKYSIFEISTVKLIFKWLKLKFYKTNSFLNAEGHNQAFRICLLSYQKAISQIIGVIFFKLSNA